MSNPVQQPRALVIHHLRTGAPDLATEALAAAGYALDHRHPIEGDPLPDPSEGHRVALVHGSLADVTKLEAPGIAEEQRWIDAWWRSGRPYLGICHGLQLAAQHLGARVGPPEHGKAEFGYYPLRSREPDVAPDGLHVFQWHYYGADLPAGAERVAGSDLYPNQIVRFGPARYGLQGHAELSRSAQRFLQTEDAEGMTLPGAQDLETQTELADRHFEPMQSWMRGFLARWLDEAARADAV
ncbi:MAG: glutamine amidotransferase [Pseudomonadota bacterium]